MKLFTQIVGVYMIFLTCANTFQYHSYMPFPLCNSKEAVKYPRNLHELRQLVNEAGSRYQTLKPIGALHSASEIICTEGTPVSLNHFKDIRLNGDNSVTVGCGATLDELAKYLHSNGRTLAHWPSIGLITVCGAIGTGAHGSSLQRPTAISDQVISIRVVDGLLNTRVVKVKDLEAFRINLGLLGFLFEVDLETVESFKLEFSRKIESESILTSGKAEMLARNSEYLQIHWFPKHAKVAVLCGVYRNKETEGNAFTAFYGETDAKATASFQAAYDSLQERRHYEALHAVGENTLLSLVGDVIDSSPIMTEDGVTMKNPAVGWNFNLTMGSCKRCGWSQGKDSYFTEDASFGCDIRDFKGIVEAIKKVGRKQALVLPISGVNFRFHRESSALMSIGYKRPQGVVIVEMVTPARTDFRNKPKAGLGALQEISQTLVSKFGCRPHWGKNGRVYKTTSVLQSILDLEALQAFKNAAKKYDPIGLFRNGFSKQLLGEKEDGMSSQLERCALQEKCFCSKDQDCLDTEQKCDMFTVSNKGIENSVSICKDKVVFFNEPLGPHDVRNLSDIFRAANV